jgi:hypothetical protein
MKACEDYEYLAQLNLNLSMNGSEPSDLAQTALLLGKGPSILIEYEDGWAQDTAETLWRREKSFSCLESNLDSLATQTTAHHYSD